MYSVYSTVQHSIYVYANAARMRAALDHVSKNIIIKLAIIIENGVWKSKLSLQINLVAIEYANQNRICKSKSSLQIKIKIKI